MFVIGVAMALQRMNADISDRERLRFYAFNVGLEYLGDPDSPQMGDWGFQSLLGPERSPWATQFSDFEPFRSNAQGRVTKVMVGNIKGNEWQIFDYRYTERSGKSSTTYEFQVFTVKLPGYFPRLEIKPEHFGSNWFVGPDLNVESAEFNRKYRVETADREFAFGVLHPQLIEKLIQAPSLTWQLAGNHLVLVDEGRINTGTVDSAIRLMVQFLHLMPPYLREDYGGKNWTF